MERFFRSVFPFFSPYAEHGVGEQVNEDVGGGQEKKIVVRSLEEFLALGAGGPADGLNGLDAEGFDDGFGNHGGVV
jgi:hypothetical protein